MLKYESDLRSQSPRNSSAIESVFVVKYVADESEGEDTSRRSPLKLQLE